MLSAKNLGYITNTIFMHNFWAQLFYFMQSIVLAEKKTVLISLENAFKNLVKLTPE